MTAESEGLMEAFWGACLQKLTSKYLKGLVLTVAEIPKMSLRHLRSTGNIPTQVYSNRGTSQLFHARHATRHMSEASCSKRALSDTEYKIADTYSWLTDSWLQWWGRGMFSMVMAGLPKLYSST